MTKINFPKPKTQTSDPFEQVDFVHGKSEKELKQIILRLWSGLDAIASSCEHSTPHITESIDSLKDAFRYGGKWELSKPSNEVIHFLAGKVLVQVDKHREEVITLKNGELPIQLPRIDADEVRKRFPITNK